MRTLDAQGLLFVGDPHLSSRKPHRRLDDYTAAVLDKIDQTVQIANEKRLLWVCLGDLFDRPRDTDPAMFTQLLRLLRLLWQPGVILVGNHDKVTDRLTDDTALGLLRETRSAQVVCDPGPVARVRTDASDIVLMGYPHGCALPRSVTRAAPRMVAITHHDLAIGAASYPGAVVPEPIEGIDLVVNGHDHTTKPWQTVGHTLYCNVGNITRVSVAQVEHIPQVFALSGKDLALQGIPLRFARDVFDLTGYHAAKAGAREVEQDLQQRVSAFVQMLQAEEKTGSAAASEDGQEVWAEIESVLAQQEKTPTGLPALLAEVMQRARQE